MEHNELCPQETGAEVKTDETPEVSGVFDQSATTGEKASAVSATAEAASGVPVSASEAGAEALVKPSLRARITAWYRAFCATKGANLCQAISGVVVGLKRYVWAVVAVVLLLVGVGVYQGRDAYVAIKQFTTVYSFVPEKISKSAAIRIQVPEGVTEPAAQAGISFSPEVKGEWVAEDMEQTLVFQPAAPLRSGVYYAVNMDTGTVQMSGDFFVDEDPKVEAIFPAAGSETHEDSEITIVFNRPMVPLTTLTMQEQVSLPITITPETPGKFKWISTRNLQFIPETTLVPSSDYTVSIGEGLVSVDQLPVAPMTHSFVTRPLRYEFVSSGQIGYRSPVVVQFNQPVDIDKTQGLISVKQRDGDVVSVEVEYGEYTYYDREAGKSVTEADPSKLLVYQRKDKHGRSRLWDFDTTYEVSIDGASPLAGTKDLTQGKRSTVSVPNIVSMVVAQSDRSDAVRPDLLDPQGTLAVNFYEAVDKDASRLNVKGVRAVAYGETCKTDAQGEIIQLGSGCEKEADQKTLIFSFNPDSFTTGEDFKLELQKIETPDGFRLNAEPITIDLKTYPSFQLYRTIPDDQATRAAIDGLYVCSNTPLKDPSDAGMSSYVQTSGYIVFGRWSPSRYLEEAYPYDHCQAGEFETNIRYGLLPEVAYTLQLSLRDEFGQEAGKQLAFTTEPPKEQYTRFHNLQKQYNVTPPDRTTFTYAVENLESVDLHICQLEPETFLERVTNPVDGTVPPTSAGCTNVVTKQIPLPARYWVNNYFQINLADYFTDTRGHYVITFSSPLYKESYKHLPLYDRTYVSVTNLAVGKKEVEYNPEQYWSRSSNPAKSVVLEAVLGQSNNLYWVNNSKTLTPAVGAVVTQYAGGDDKEFVKKATGYTDYQTRSWNSLGIQAPA